MTTLTCPNLARDLALLPGLADAWRDVAVAAYEGAMPIDRGDAIAQAVECLRAAEAPAIIGLHQLTMEATRAAVLLAAALRGRLLPAARSLPLRVEHAARIDEVLGADLVIQVAFVEDRGPIAAAVAAKGLPTIELDCDLKKVLALRAHLRGEAADEAATASATLIRQAADMITAARRVGVMLSAGTDDRVVSQWHKLASDVQSKVRMSVLQLPADAAANERGAAEVVRWLTGLSITQAAVDFAGDEPRPCPAGQADVLLDFSQTKAGVCERRIVVGPARDKSAALNFITPGPAMGLAARVMRCDGVMLWLCDDPSTAPPDPAVALLDQLRNQLEDPPCPDR